jgi:hypothetical protein
VNLRSSLCEPTGTNTTAVIVIVYNNIIVICPLFRTDVTVGVIL